MQNQPLSGVVVGYWICYQELLGLTRSQAFNSNCCFGMWHATNADYLLTFRLLSSGY